MLPSPRPRHVAGNRREVASPKPPPAARRTNKMGTVGTVRPRRFTPKKDTHLTYHRSGNGSHSCQSTRLMGHPGSIVSSDEGRSMTRTITTTRPKETTMTMSTMKVKTETSKWRQKKNRRDAGEAVLAAQTTMTRRMMTMAQKATRRGSRPTTRRLPPLPRPMSSNMSTL